MRTLKYLVPLLVSGLVGGCMHSEPSGETGQVDGMITPELEGRDADGLLVKLSDLRGKVVLVDFWQMH